MGVANGMYDINSDREVTSLQNKTDIAVLKMKKKSSAEHLRLKSSEKAVIVL